MLDSYRDLIDGLLETPSALRSLLGDPVPDDASPETVEILREMNARETVTLRRARSVMRKDSMSLLAIEHEPEIESLGSASGSASGQAETRETPEALLTSFNDNRTELISLLVNLTLRDWERPVNHEILGETVLSDEIEDHLTWDESIVDRLTAAVS